MRRERVGVAMLVMVFSGEASPEKKQAVKMERVFVERGEKSDV